MAPGDDYGSVTAAHYAVYRPPLHGAILKELLGASCSVSCGLDVGCGTGRSAIALTDYCRYVVAIDPAEAMLARASQHPLVEYRRQRNSGLADQLRGRRFGLISFAGWLFYQDEAAVIAGFPDVLEAKVTAVVYDFEADLRQLFDRIGFIPPASDYDHRRSFDRCLSRGLKPERELVRGDFIFRYRSPGSPPPLLGKRMAGSAAAQRAV